MHSSSQGEHMNGKKKKPDSSLLRKAVIKSVELTRYAVRNGKPDKSKPVMTTGRCVEFIEKSVTNWKLDVTRKNMLTPSRIKPDHAKVKADWFTAQDALEAGIRVVSGGSANVFGAMGALLVPDGFRIPTVMATKENVKYYGLDLIESGSTFSIASGKCPVALMQFNFSGSYQKEFLMSKYGGGGVFVETHDFPHIHIPTSKDCGGYIVIGKHIGHDEYHFTAFQIPYKHALYTPSKTIHGDGTLVGGYAVAVADSRQIKADTVLLYNRNTLEMARKVVNLAG
jgi:microcystin-dependent protein